MTFTDEQKTELAKPLNSAHVKPPAPGKYGDYIEGWRVIDEANRIFGFDGWTRETVVMVETNRDHKEGKFFVGYMAKVRVTAGGVIREGTGFGSGVSKNLGDAIESAAKEAETDSMKRALMTFGNPFGLALYDKTKANVADVADEPDDSLQVILDSIATCETSMALANWLKINEEEALEHPSSKKIIDAFNLREESVRQMDRVAA